MSTIRAELPKISIRKGPSAVAVVRGFARVAIVVGLILVGFVAYQFGVTSYFARQAQEGLRLELAARSDSVAVVPYEPRSLPLAPIVVPEGLSYPESPSVVITPVEVPPPIDQPVLVTEDAAFDGDAIGRIVIPAAGVDWTFVEGVGRDSLRSGAGHMPTTALPGQPGNAVISGHRTTYGAPFFHLDRVIPGDLITIESATGAHIYQTVEVLVVEPGDVWVTDQWDGAWLTLTTCNPVFSSRQRLVVVARLVAGPNAGVILDGS